MGSPVPIYFIVKLLYNDTGLLINNLPQTGWIVGIDYRDLVGS